MRSEAAETALRGDVERMLGCLTEPALAGLAAQLRIIPGLAASERSVVRASVATTLRDVLWFHVRKVVLVELHAARMTGQLGAEDPSARWDEWVDTLAASGGWEKVTAPYPDLLPRLRALIADRCAAARRFAVRLARDRAALAPLLGGEPGLLAEVTPGAGDAHHGGQTVTLFRMSAGPVVYKPRSLAADAALARLLPRLVPDEPDDTRIRVPAALPREDPAGRYGWAAHVAHRYCDGDGELRTFYRGLGQWLAVLRLVSGSDLHSENLIACGPVPVVVDCETLFTPYRAAEADGYGAATALAADLLGQSVLRTGLLPGRGAALGRRGTDISAAGSLPGQQPEIEVPGIVHHGTDRARLGTTTVPLPPRANRPSPEPDLGRYWEQVLGGFTELTGRLRRLDAAGELAPLLAGFADVPVRVVLRDTASYAEISRMLWHPASLYEPEPARQRAATLLARQARHRPGAPDDDAVIHAEIDQLLAGDVPVFTTTPATGVLTGPDDVRWGAPQDLIAATLRRWSRSDLATDRQVIRSTLVSAYLNDGWIPEPDVRRDPPARTDDLDRRRRALAASILRQLSQAAVRGGDGTVTWVAPTYDPTGWGVRLTAVDFYNGHAGVALLLAGYLREVAHGRADPVPELPDLLPAVVRTIRMTEDQQAAERAAAAADGMRARPPAPGAYVGLGSGILGWLLLHRLGAVAAGEAVQRSERLASLLPEALAADDQHDLVSGAAGAVVPLLGLSAATGDNRWRELALTIGHRLGRHATADGRGACWPNGQFQKATVRAAHGVAGIGWALARLAIATGDPAARELAGRAFAWGETHYDPRRQGWRNARDPADERLQVSWCHGAAGFGLCAADLLARDGGADQWGELLSQAAAAVARDGFGDSFSLCHGDLGSWEVLARAHAAGVAPAGESLAAGSLEAVQARIVTSLEVHGTATGIARVVFQPGLLAGSGGLAYQLLRMHPDSDLPSALLPDPVGDRAEHRVLPVGPL